MNAWEMRIPRLSGIENSNLLLLVTLEVFGVTRFGRSDDQLAIELGTLGYPGFAYLAAGVPADPAEVLMDAIDRDDLDARVTEGLPWIPLGFADLDWDWLIPEAVRKKRQNRLGFIVALATDAASASIRQKLLVVLGRLEKVKRAECDTLCRESMPSAERVHRHNKRSRLAADWNLDTGLTVEDLQHLSAPFRHDDV